MKNIQTSSTINICDLTKNNIYVERYKYILEKIKFLDTLMHKNFALYAKFTLAIGTALSTCFVLFIEKKIESATSVVILKSLFFTELLASLLFFAITIAIIRAWFNYRDDEFFFLNKIECDLDRKPPTLEGMLKWSETYFLITTIIIALTSLLGVANAELLLNFVAS
ncbi:hypothetical protein [Pseudoalteromonas sp.]|uniref:hypothetical protein n=1 Tax=Pseudoalteromonas sp. TaxID=53249 RepID=UPI0023554715|nr:hypothetical protein [Pseudoalteromonas sp.]